MNIGRNKSGWAESLRLMAMGMAMILLFTNCSSSRQSGSRRQDYFVLTNAVAEGKSVQVLKSTFGLGIQPTKSDVFVQFGTNGFLTVNFDPTNMMPQAILWETVDAGGKPRYSMYDLNADGIPEARMLEQEGARQVYYQGEWFYFERDKSYFNITNQGKSLSLYFDGERMREVSGRNKN